MFGEDTDMPMHTNSDHGLIRSSTVVHSAETRGGIALRYVMTSTEATCDVKSVQKILKTGINSNTTRS